MFNIPQNNWNFINDKRLEELNEIYNKIKFMFFPKEENVLNFLKIDFNNIKYIIVGMEPYPSSYVENNIVIPEATGRSFEVSSILNKTWSSKFKQSSLRNIIKTIYYNETGNKINLDELREKIESNEFLIKQPKDWFNSMENQGVLFLNATLTVEPYNVGSHVKLWNDFMKELILHINNNLEVKWMLWGNDAKQRVCNLINKENCILSCHPRLPQFIDQNCFQYTPNVNWLGT